MEEDLYLIANQVIEVFTVPIVPINERTLRLMTDLLSIRQFCTYTAQ